MDAETNLEESEEFFEVEKILDAREQDNILYYLVHWQGYTSQDDTWEPSDNLLTCHKLVDAFWIEQDKRNASRRAQRKEKKMKRLEAKIKREISLGDIEDEQKVFSSPQKRLTSIQLEFGATRSEKTDELDFSSLQKPTQSKPTVEAQKHTVLPVNVLPDTASKKPIIGDTGVDISLQKKFTIGDAHLKDEKKAVPCILSLSSSEDESEEDEGDKKARELIAKWHEMRKNAKRQSPAGNDMLKSGAKDGAKEFKNAKKDTGPKHVTMESLAKKGGTLALAQAHEDSKEQESDSSNDKTSISSSSKFLLPEKHRPASFNTISNIIQEGLRVSDEKLKLSPEKLKDASKVILPCKSVTQSYPSSRSDIASPKTSDKQATNPFAKVNLLTKVNQPERCIPGKEVPAQESTSQKKTTKDLFQDRGKAEVQKTVTASDKGRALSDRDDPRRVKPENKEYASVTKLEQAKVIEKNTDEVGGYAAEELNPGVEERLVAREKDNIEEHGSGELVGVRGSETDQQLGTRAKQGGSTLNANNSNLINLVTSTSEKQGNKKKMKLSFDKLNIGKINDSIKGILKGRHGEGGRSENKKDAASNVIDPSEQLESGKVAFSSENSNVVDSSESPEIIDEEGFLESRTNESFDGFVKSSELASGNSNFVNPKVRDSLTADLKKTSKTDSAPDELSHVSRPDVSGLEIGVSAPPVNADKGPRISRDSVDLETVTLVTLKESMPEKYNQQVKKVVSAVKDGDEVEASVKSAKKTVPASKEKPSRLEKKAETKGMSKVRNLSGSDCSLFEFTKVKSVATNEQNTKQKTGLKRGADDRDTKKVSIDPLKKARYAHQRQPSKEAFLPTKDDILGGILGRSEMMKSIDEKGEKKEEVKEGLEQNKPLENESSSKLDEESDMYFDFDEYCVDERGLFPSDNEEVDDFLQAVSLDHINAIQMSQESFVKAVRSGDWSQVLGAVAWGCNPDYWDTETKGTLLWKAIEGKQYDAAKKLLAMGANVNYKAENGKTALIVAVEHGMPGIVIMLLRAGSHINTQLHNEETALILACRKGHEDIINILLSYGADAKLIPKANPKDVYEFSPDYKHLLIRKIIEKHNRLLVTTAESMLKLTLEATGAQLHPHQLCRCISPGEKTVTELYFNCQHNAGEKGITVVLLCASAQFTQSGQVFLHMDRQKDNGVDTVLLNKEHQIPVVEGNRSMYFLFPKVGQLNLLTLRTHKTGYKLLVFVCALECSEPWIDKKLDSFYKEYGRANKLIS